MVVIFFVFGLIIGGALLWGVLQYRVSQQLHQECQRLENEVCAYEEAERALADLNEHMQVVKQERKDKILELFVDNVQLTSRKVAERLAVSQRTVRNYMSELVEEGLVMQSDETGRGVRYKLVGTEK